MRERISHGVAHCVAEFEGGHRTVEGRGDSLRIAWLRAFVESRFNDSVDDVMHQAQARIGKRVEPIGERNAGVSFEDLPRPDAQIGDIKSAPR